MTEEVPVLLNDSIFGETADAMSDPEAKWRLTTFAGIGICVEGECNVVINEQHYHLQKDDMCLILPGVMLHVAWKSRDFAAYAVAVTQDFFGRINLPLRASLYLSIRESPCISLNANEMNRLMTLCDELKEMDRYREHPFRYEISQSLSVAITYEIAAVYHKKPALQSFSFSRKNELFMKFRQLVALHHSESRKIEFYADKLCISEHYLSIIAKQISGLSASECIERIMIANAKSLLVSTEMTIQQIADRLNFPNASFFSKYFKRITGQTPKEYRSSR
jgi:AraC-like DNA-binding protein